jgi:hypothetical protein
MFFNSLKMVFILILMFSLMACQDKEAPKVEKEMSKPSRVIDLSEVTTEMIVKEIDLPSRLFTLEYSDGNEIVVEAAPDLTGLDKIKVGDKVKITYLKSTAVYVTSPDADRPSLAGARTVEVDAKGERPRKLTVEVTEQKSTVMAIDLENRKATLKDAEGKVETIDVSPEVKNLENVKVGDIVVYQVTEAVAVNIEKVE